MSFDFFEKISNFILNLFSGEIRNTVVRTEEAVKRIDKDCDELKKDMKSTSESIADMRPKVEFLWQKAMAPGNSPMQLNEEGLRIFNQSGIKDIILENKPMFLEAIREKNPLTAYDVQEIAKQVVNILKEKSDIVARLKDGAFRAGVDIDSVLFTGSLLLRDIALKELGFESEDPNNKPQQ